MPFYSLSHFGKGKSKQGMSYRKLFISLAVALSFSSCGGGGSGGGSGVGGGGGGGDTGRTLSPSLPDTSVRTPGMEAPFGSGSAVLEKAASGPVGEAAGTAPASGSVTQSSNGDGDPDNPTTTDAAHVTVRVDGTTGQLQWEVEVPTSAATISVSVSDESDNVNVLGRERGVDYDYYGIALHKEENGGLLWVDVYTDFTPVETATSIGMWESVEVGDSIVGFAGYRGELDGRPGRFDCSSDCYYNNDMDGMVEEVENVDFTPVAATYSGDPDYLAGGVWVYVPAGAAGPEDYEFGAFVDGNDPFTAANLDGLTGEAVYLGEADGVYTDREEGNYFFTARVDLRADFDNDTISGTMDDFFYEVYGQDEPGGYRRLGGYERLFSEETILSLEETDIDTRTPDNFFTGDTAMSFGGDEFTGKWGGQFYGNGDSSTDRPGSVAGTFGGATDDGTKAFLGVFGADKRVPPIDDLVAARVAAAGNSPTKSGSGGGVTQSSNGGDTVEATVRMDNGDLQWEAERVSGTNTVSVGSETADMATTSLDHIYLREDLVSGGTVWVDAVTDFLPVFEEAALSTVTTAVTVGATIDFYDAYTGTYNGQVGIFECGEGCDYEYDYDYYGNLIVTAATGLEFIPVTDASIGDIGDDPDYLVWGIWYYDADFERTGNYEIGVFTDGNDPFVAGRFLTALAGTANYGGGVFGLYRDSDDESGCHFANCFFGGRVTLTANFDNDTISGSIYNFSNDRVFAGGNPTLALERAGIDNDNNFFEGDTSMAFAGDDFTGRWGGQFYGNTGATDHPGSVGGTFGGATDDGERAFLGAFHGYRGFEFFEGVAGPPTEVPPIEIVRAPIVEAAGNAPASGDGSVHQSSNGDADDITTDTVEVAVSVDANTGELQWEWERVSGTSTVSVSSESDIAFPLLGGDDFEGVGLYKRLEDGELEVDIYTDFTSVATTATTTSGGGTEVDVSTGDVVTFEGIFAGNSIMITAGEIVYPGTYGGMSGAFICAMACQVATDSDDEVTSVMNLRFIPGGIVTGPNCFGTTCASSSVTSPGSTTTTTYSGDSDYLAGGVWLYAPDDAAGTGDYEVGAFVDGNDPFTAANLDGLTGEAVYMGVDDVTGVYTDSGEDRNYLFDASVSLTADFDDNEISGSIFDFYEDGVPVAGSPTLTLGTAGIDTDANFFTGDTSMTFDGDAFAGKWGGRFYGNGANAADHPGSVAGTFGGATADDTKAFLGVFGADRQ